MTAVAISIFISMENETLSIRSLSADDPVSRAVERMLIEQTENTFKYMAAAVSCADKITKAKS